MPQTLAIQWRPTYGPCRRHSQVMPHTISRAPVPLHPAFSPDAFANVSSLAVQRRGSDAFVQLEGAFNLAAQRHLHETLEWLFDTGTSAIRIEVTGCQDMPDPTGTVIADASTPTLVARTGSDRSRS